ncbi:glutathione S-transferase [Marinicella sp. S1101]|uniref:glutathione S-transferase n=1 Tax=Marinicella marina TaxID=2996016 RepID=UPI00226083A3|nr:glutathione S-transferase [Marinicella marina]MCX7555117.1 glutathione S-transferase [Marinicella marina]MDJ1140326.1 glutathione S-transferase [Marinicella marina]
MITVHHLNNSRSQRILWLLEELGVDYEIKRYERDAETQLAPKELQDVHPLGKSPVVTDGDQVLAESGAIIDYLGYKYGDGKWVPRRNSKKYQPYVYWSHYAEGSLMSPLLLKLVFDKVKESPMPFFVKPIAKAIANKVMSSFVTPNIIRHFKYVEAHLAENTYFAGKDITGADIQMSFPLEASVAKGAITEQSHPNIYRYVRAFQDRPAYQRALEQGGEYDYVD